MTETASSFGCAYEGPTNPILTALSIGPDTTGPLPCGGPGLTPIGAACVLPASESEVGGNAALSADVTLADGTSYTLAATGSVPISQALVNELNEAATAVASAGS